MERKYSRQLLDAITGRQQVVQENGIDILVKPIPEDSAPGTLDPRLYASMAPMLKGIKGFMVKQMMKPKPGKKVDLQKSAQQMRNMMNGVKSIPIAQGVDTREAQVNSGGVDIPVRIYTPQTPGEGLQPVFYYIHGGGFVAGSMDVVEEMCKLVVQNTGCVAVSVGYRLAPEHPFPAGLDDCYAVLKWIYENAADFGGDGRRICISGDSAGGNLATVCALRDRDDGTGMVKVQALLYPTVDAAGMAQNIKRRDVYEIAPAQAKVINALLDMMGSLGNSPTLSDYLGVADDTIPYVSPTRADLHGMPPCILLFGEYDFLRVEDDAYAAKLSQAGVQVKTVRYRGLSHGFADQVGVTPQAEDALNEIGRFMMEHLQS